MLRANPYAHGYVAAPSTTSTPSNHADNTTSSIDVKERRKLKKNKREKQRRTEINEKVSF